MSPDRATTTWRLLALDLPVGAPEESVREQACAALGVPAESLRGFRIARRSLDARRRGGVRRLRFVVHADLVLDATFQSAALRRAERAGRVVRPPERATLDAPRIDASLRGAGGPAHAAVVGAGPAGLFAAWVLARNGLAVTVIDRGARLDRRGRDVVRFHRTREPNPESNLLYGEGGAGTYSDGKLYTRVEDPLEVPLLDVLVECGAPRDILYDSRAHIGTDRLHRILPELRARLEAEGVRFLWDTRVKRLVLREDPGGARVAALATTSGEIACDAAFLALGHSARDTFAALRAQGLALEAKPFQLGLRVEHPQELIDERCHGAGPEARSLGAAYYNLVAPGGDGLQGVHSFCMCPGGRIVAAVAEPGLLCTNGMSNSTHSSRWANAALVVTLDPREHGEDALAGVELQRVLERRFFEAGGGDYTAPAQRVDDFLAARESRGSGPSSYALGTRPARLDQLLPEPAVTALRRALARFDRAIPGFAGPEGQFVGLESRSSGPLRMPRDPATRRAQGFANLYPTGEGAGWAGGIMSAAIDGARSALALCEHGLSARASARLEHR